MAFSILQVKRAVQSGSDAATWTATFDNPTTAGSTLVGGALAIDTSFTTAVAMTMADNASNTWLSPAGSQSNLPGGGAFIRAGMLYVPNCLARSGHAVTVTPGAVGQGDIFIIELGSMASSSLDSAYATPGTGNATPAVSGALTPLAAGIHVSMTGYRHNGGDPVWTPAGGWTAFAGGDPVSQVGTYAMYRAAVAAAAQTPSISYTNGPLSDGWAGLHAVFLESSGGGGGSTVLMGQVCAPYIR